jgi:predicted outer membrane repeat protein
MTQVTYLGKQSEEKKNPIEFLYYLTNERAIHQSACKPSEFKHVLVLSENYNDTNLAAFFAYNGSPNGGAIYLGNLNDGVV